MRIIELEYDGVALEVHIENGQAVEIEFQSDADAFLVYHPCDRDEIEELALEKYREEEISFRVDQAIDFNRGL